MDGQSNPATTYGSTATQSVLLINGSNLRLLKVLQSSAKRLLIRITINCAENLKVSYVVATSQFQQLNFVRGVVPWYAILELTAMSIFLLFIVYGGEFVCCPSLIFHYLASSFRLFHYILIIW